jgi:hypothetical protein
MQCPTDAQDAIPTFDTPERHRMHEATSVANSNVPNILMFFHSLLRWGIVITVALAGAGALKGYLAKGPVIVWQRSMAIWAMVLCHVQLIIGIILYGMDLGKGTFALMPPDHMRYWKFEHVGMMVIAIALVTVGRIASKKAKTEQGKHLRIAVFYLIALALMLWMIPWPFTAMGEGRGWI